MNTTQFITRPDGDMFTVFFQKVDGLWYDYDSFYSHEEAQQCVDELYELDAKGEF